MSVLIASCEFSLPAVQVSQPTECTKTKTTPFSWSVISAKEANAPIHLLLSSVIPLDPLQEIISEYLQPIVFNQKQTNYQMYRSGKGAKNKFRHYPIYSSNFNEIIQLDIVKEIELTQDCNSMGGSYYRACLRFSKKCMVEGKLVLRKYVYYFACIGSPAGDRWPLPFAGPKIAMLPDKAIYRLSTGGIFDLERRDYDCKLVRRY